MNEIKRTFRQFTPAFDAARARVRRVKAPYLIAGLLALFAVLWIASGAIGRKDGAPPPAPNAVADPMPEVRVRTVKAESRARAVVVAGRTEANRAADLKAETQGRIAEKAVAKGARVKVGDVIVNLAMDDRAARLAEAEAQVEFRKIAYEASRKLSANEFRSKVKVGEDMAALNTALAALERIRLDIRRTRIVAPFDGTVEALPVEAGSLVAVGERVARIVDLSTVVVAGEIGERDIAEVKVGEPAVAELPDGRSLDGRVRFVSRASTKQTRTFLVEAEFANPDGAVPEGLTAKLRLPLGAQPAHRVSPAVLTLSDDGALGVKSVGDDGVVAFHPVAVVGDTPGGLWLGGLPETVTLITVGQEFVKAGQKVKPVLESTVAKGAK